MATKFPGPNYNRIIETDPQIVKVPMDYYGWGARASVVNKSSPPNAPEMSIRHVKD